MKEDIFIFNIIAESGYKSRHAGSGTWHTEKKNPVIESKSGRVLGYKQMLSFCLYEEDGDRSKRKRKKSTGRVMYEYELPTINAYTRQYEEPVLCLIKKSTQAISSSQKKQATSATNATFPSTSSYVGLLTSTLDSYAIADFVNPACLSLDSDTIATIADFANLLVFTSPGGVGHGMRHPDDSYVRHRS